MRRTTLILNERRLSDLKRLAAERGETVSALVDQMLADGIRRATMTPKRPGRLPLFRMGEPRVNVADRDQLWEAMERR